MAIDAPVKLAFRCDSSSHRDAMYMVAGGVAFRTGQYAAISAAIQGIKDAANIQSEMKWSKFRGGERTQAYEAVIDLFYSLIDINQLHFHAIVAEFGKFSHGAFEGGNPEASVNRMYFQLLAHAVCKYYSSKCYIFVYPDKGNDSRDLHKFHGEINRLANQRYGVGHKLARIEQADSEKCNVLQMVDIIIGGMAHMRNFPDAVGAKADLAKYVLRGAKLSGWEKGTPRSARRFTVWNFRHQKLIAGEKASQSARRYIRQG